MDKKTFVEDIFSKFAAALNCGITSLEYSKTGSKEIVTMHYENGFDKHINVAGDSRWGIACDVIAKIN